MNAELLPTILTGAAICGTVGALVKMVDQRCYHWRFCFSWFVPYFLLSLVGLLICTIFA